MTQAAGKLNHRIRLESLETSQDANGETVETWTHEGDVWANVSPVSGKEFISSAAMQSQIVARITVRYRADIQATWRILFRNRYYNIEAVLADVVSGLEYMTLPVSLGIIPNEDNPWDVALLSLRQFISDNYNQPNPHNQPVMSSPPTVSALAGNQAGIAITYNYTSDVIEFSGGWEYVSSGVRHFPCATQSASGGSIPGLPGVNGTMWRASTMVNASRVWIQINGSGGIRYRFIVDGQYVNLTGTLSNNTSSPRYFLLDFGTKAVRKVSVESIQHLGFIAFCVGSADECTLPANEIRRVIVLGDSITQGSAATYQADGFSAVTGDMLGIRDCWSSGIGDTGYVADSAGTRFALPDRLSDCNGRGPWDIIVVAMGTNDQSETGVKAAAEQCLVSLRANNQAAQIFVLGPWDRYAPGPVDPSYTTTKLAIQSAVAEVGLGIRFIDPQGVSYAQSDGLHPTTSGHKTLGDWLALQIKNTIGA